MDDARPASAADPAPLGLWCIAVLTALPFPISALIFAFGPRPLAADALSAILTWSTVVLGFIGGVRWGLETAAAAPRWERLLLSLVWPAAAWGMFLAYGRLADAWILSAFLAAFLLQWLFDARGPLAAARYPALSTTLTASACISLALVLEQTLAA